MCPAPVNKLCILRLSSIGDVCQAVAAVQAIQTTYPDAEVTWIIGKVEHELLKDLPGVEFIIFDKSKGKAAFAQLKQDMLGKSFDVLLNMQVTLLTNLAAKLIPAKRKIGFDWHRSKALHALFTNERIKAQTHAHVLESFFAFAEKIGVPESAKHKLSWNIPVSVQDEQFALSHIPDNTPCVIIVPSASKAERNWTKEGYACLAEHASIKGFKILLCGGPTEPEKQLGLAIQSNTQFEIGNLIGQTSLKQMLALLKRASLLVAPDCSPIHMAVSQGTPVLGLYAHSNPKHSGPYLFQDYLVEVYHKHLLKMHNKTDNQLPWGTRIKGKELMKDISLETVLAQFDRICVDFNLESEA